MDKLKEIEAKEINGYYQWQLVYPMSTLRNLTKELNTTFID